MRFSLRSLLLSLTILCILLGIEEYRLSEANSKLEKETQTKEMWRNSSEYWQKNYYQYYFLYDGLRTKWNDTISLVGPEQRIMVDEM